MWGYGRAETGEVVASIRADEQGDAGEGFFVCVDRLLPSIDEDLIRVLICAVGRKRTLNQRAQAASTPKPDGCTAVSFSLVGKIISSDAPTGPATAIATKEELEPYLALRLGQETVPGGLIERYSTAAEARSIRVLFFRESTNVTVPQSAGALPLAKSGSQEEIWPSSHSGVSKPGVMSELNRLVCGAAATMASSSR